MVSGGVGCWCVYSWCGFCSCVGYLVAFWLVYCGVVLFCLIVVIDLVVDLDAWLFSDSGYCFGELCIVGLVVILMVGVRCLCWLGVAD